MHLLDITNPASIGTLDIGSGPGFRNMAPLASTNTARMEAIAVYMVGGQPYFIATWTHQQRNTGG